MKTVSWFGFGVGGGSTVSSEEVSLAACVRDLVVDSALPVKVELLRRCSSATASSLMRSSKLGRPSFVAFVVAATAPEFDILLLELIAGGDTAPTDEAEPLRLRVVCS